MIKGGKGSGNFGHGGRSGERGGSSSKGGSDKKKELKQHEARLQTLEHQRQKSETARESIRTKYRSIMHDPSREAERDQTWKDLQQASISHHKLLQEMDKVKSRIANIKADLDIGKGSKKISNELKKAIEPIPIGSFLQAKIHDVFTRCADVLAMTGKINMDERIALSSAIGDGLKAFRDSMEHNVPEGAAKILQPDDIQRLL